MNKKIGQLESLLLVAGKPLSFSNLATLLSLDASAIKDLTKELALRYNTEDHGVHVMINNDKIQLISNPAHASLISEFIKDETTGELTKPSLETLTIIAYRQPVSKEVLEQIRGVNCSLILRNLMIRGLIESKEERAGLTSMYSVTMDFLRFLGITSVEELPDYERLKGNATVETLLAQNAEPKQT